MAHKPTGGQQRLAQHATADLSGGIASDQFVTTDSGAKSDGDIAIWQDGLVVGVPAIAESGVTDLVSDLAAKAPNARTISTTVPLTGGGDLSADRTIAISDFVGDSGSGGTKGAVPAPGAGDAAAGKFLKADGTWTAPSGVGGSPLTTKGDVSTYSTTDARLAVGANGTVLTADSAATTGNKWAYPPLTIGFIMNTGATGTGVGPSLTAPRAGSITTCKFVTKTSDGAVALTFTIKQNGVAVFTSSRTVAAGTSAGTVSTFTALTSTPLAVAADDVFTIDISVGSSAWAFTVQLES